MQPIINHRPSARLHKCSVSCRFIMREDITMTKGDASGSIDELISFLNEAKSKGATNYSMRWSGDPMWAFKWFETYRIKSEQEIKNEEIERLQKRLSELSENGS